MVDPRSTQEIVDDLRRRGAETSSVELKAAHGGLPRSVRETLSAFANADGGVLVLGVDDKSLQPVDINPIALRDSLAGAVADQMTPPLRGNIEIDTIDDDHQVVRMDVDELDVSEKPCYVTERGRYGGSFIRVGDGDRKLTSYEIDRLVENRKQPRFDREIVPDATLADLDAAVIGPFLARMREQHPRVFEKLVDEEALQKLGVVKLDGEVLRPTLAGLLAFGTYPQQFYPQLFVSFVVLPTTVMGDLGPNGERFIDNASCAGPIPEMIAEAVRAVTRNLRHASVMEGIYRVERLDYPIEVIRELIANAIMHRDYSPMATGSQIQVELYPDRLVVRSPGGFYGNVSPDDLGLPNVSSSRNELLATLLTDVPLPGANHMIAENRGSGIPTVMRSLGKAGMAPPVFDADLTRVEVTVPQHALLTPDVLEWVSSLGDDFTEAQIQSLALLRSGGTVRNQTLQGWGLHRTDATKELADLVRRGLVKKVGDRKGATYALARPLDDDPSAAPDNGHAQGDRAAIIGLLEQSGEMSAKDIGRKLSLPYTSTMKKINVLIDKGIVEPTAPPRSRYRRYRLR